MRSLLLPRGLGHRHQLRVRDRVAKAETIRAPAVGARLRLRVRKGMFRLPLLRRSFSPHRLRTMATTASRTYEVRSRRTSRTTL